MTKKLLIKWLEQSKSKALSAVDEQRRTALKKYDEELEKLQADFRKSLQAVDDRNAVLRESLRLMNTAENHEQLKEGLLSLADKDAGEFTEKDWDEFLDGTKTIEL